MIIFLGLAVVIAGFSKTQFWKLNAVYFVESTSQIFLLEIVVLVGIDKLWLWHSS
jgi:hypothetical protein